MMIEVHQEAAGFCVVRMVDLLAHVDAFDSILSCVFPCVCCTVQWNLKKYEKTKNKSTKTLTESFNWMDLCRTISCYVADDIQVRLGATMKKWKASYGLYFDCFIHQILSSAYPILSAFFKLFGIFRSFDLKMLNLLRLLK